MRSDNQDSETGQAELRPAGPAARITGWSAFAAAAPALFAPLSVMALAVDGAPAWTMLIALCGAVPLAIVGGLAATRPIPIWSLAVANGVLATAALMLAWSSGGALSPAAPWVLVGLAAVAILGGSKGALLTVAAVAAIMALALMAPEPPVRTIGFAPRAEREVTAVVSWGFAALALAAVAWGAARAWSSALPPLRHPTIAARKALSLLTEGSAICGLRLSAHNAVAQAIGAPERTIEFEREELRSLSLATLAHPDDLPVLDGLRKTALKGAPPECAVVRLRSRLGGYRWLEASAISAEGFPPPPNGFAAPDDVMLLLRDRWRAGPDASAVGEAERTGFLAHVGADLRTSLKSIIGFTDILRNELFGPLGADRYRDYARLAHEGGQALLDRVDELLDLADIEAGRFAAKNETVEVAPFVEGVMRLVRARAEAAGVAVNVEIAPSLQDVATDRRALRRVLLTMLTDGLRRASMGDSLQLEANAEDGAARFAVRARVLQRDGENVADAEEVWPAHAEGSAALGPDKGEVVTIAGEARLGRMVAASLAELMGGTSFFLGGLDAAAEELDAGDVLLSEVLLPIEAPTTDLKPPTPREKRARGEIGTRTGAAAPSPSAAAAAANAPPAVAAQAQEPSRAPAAVEAEAQAQAQAQNQVHSHVQTHVQTQASPAGGAVEMSAEPTSQNEPDVGQGSLFSASEFPRLDESDASRNMDAAAPDDLTEADDAAPSAPESTDMPLFDITDAEEDAALSNTSWSDSDDTNPKKGALKRLRRRLSA